MKDLTPSLVHALRAGDAKAGALLDALYRDAIVRFAWGYLRDADEAEDAAQDVFCKVLETTQVPDNFRAWLYRVARNHCLNRLRSRGRRKDRQRLATGMDAGDAVPGNLSRLVDEERRARLGDALAALPESQREVLLLRYSEGLSRKEIAEVVGEPVSVVKSRLYEGLEKLRRHTSLQGGD